MQRERILLLGANGQLGHELQRTLPAIGEVVALTREHVDFTKPDMLRQVVTTHRPSWIINAAAYTAVDKAESDVEVAYAVNSQAPSILAEEAQKSGAALVHYSTDYVFDGTKDAPYTEMDLPNPVSVYGKSKLAGEKAVTQHCKRHLIFRTSWVFGQHGGNFVKSMLRLAAERDSLRVVADQIGAPTSAHLIAETTVAIIRAMQGMGDNDPRWGLYHLTASGRTSWYEYARFVIAEAISSGQTLAVRPEAILPIPTKEYPSPAARPLNSCLETNKIRTNFKCELPVWKPGVQCVLHALLAESPKKANQ